MYCTKCGVELPESARFCSQCGSVTGRGAPLRDRGTLYNRLSRPRESRKLAGVSAGIARYLGVDVTLIRILFVVLSIWPPGLGLLVYLVCWIVMPNDPLLLPPATVEHLESRP